ncbi:MAG: hypothetical protein ACKVVP_23010 [Chloroflexota bacterium]
MMESTKSVNQGEAPTRTPRISQERRVFRDLFVARLHRIHEQRALYGSELTADARQLIDRALYSTYWDCVRLGLRSEAREVLGLPGD